MLNLTRMELRKIFRDKSLYITAGIILIVIFIALGTMKLVISPDLTEKAENLGMEFTSGDMADALDFQTQSLTAFLGNLLFSGGLMGTLMAIVSSIFVCDDFHTGFGKNIFSYHPNRRSYILSKLFTLAAVNGFFLLLLSLLSFVSFRLFGFDNPVGNPAELAMMLFVGWISIVSLSAQNLLFCMLTRRTIISSILSVLCSLGLFSGILELLGGLFGFHVGPFLPSYNLLTAPYLCREGISSISGGIQTLFDNISVNPLVAVFAALVWSTLYVLLASAVLNKKDIC